MHVHVQELHINKTCLMTLWFPTAKQASSRDSTADKAII